ncbi:MAG TPA: VOC family protein [Promineifilum sp.]|nr:VOC family protein [Promineifilum sp.]
MYVVTNYPDGVFNWIDLSTTDIAGARAFYSGLFGWQANNVPVGDSGVDYTFFELDGHAVAGGGQMMPEQQAAGQPAAWTSYVKYDDIDAAVARAGAAGGTVLMPPMEIPNSGRLAVLTDPSGAVFGIWSPKPFPGAALVNMPGTLAWNELQTRDLPAARAFYGQVFGWTASEMSDSYTTFAADGRMQCGSMPIGGEMWDGVPSNWAVYFMVEDVDATAARVAELGGTVLVGPQAAGEMGRLIVVRDPQGAIFTAMQFNGPMDPPPGFN